MVFKRKLLNYKSISLTNKKIANISHVTAKPLVRSKDSVALSVESVSDEQILLISFFMQYTKYGKDPISNIIKGILSLIFYSFF